MNSDTAGLVGLIVGGMVVFGSILLFYVLQKRRTEALTEIAQSLGFRFQGTSWADPAALAALRTPLFDRNPRPRFRNIMSGVFSGLRASIFDYTTGNGKQKRVQTVAAFSSDLQLPRFQLLPNNPVLRMMLKLGAEGKSFHFDSAPDFSRHWLLVAPANEEVQIRELFHPSLLEYLASIPPREMWQMEGGGQTVIVYRSRKTVRPQEVTSFLERTSSIAGTFLASCRTKQAI